MVVLFLWHMVAIFVVAVLWWCFFAVENFCGGNTCAVEQPVCRSLGKGSLYVKDCIYPVQGMVKYCNDLVLYSRLQFRSRKSPLGGILAVTRIPYLSTIRDCGNIYGRGVYVMRTWKGVCRRRRQSHHCDPSCHVPGRYLLRSM